MRFLFLLSCFLFVMMFWPHTADAQCGRGSCGPAVVQSWMPSGTVVSERPVVTVLAAPVRAVARVAVAVHERPRVRFVVRGRFCRGCR